QGASGRTPGDRRCAPRRPPGTDSLPRDRRRDAGSVCAPSIGGGWRRDRPSGVDRRRHGKRMKTKIVLLPGARPNYMKIAPTYWAIQEAAPDRFAVELVHTGQHYDASMSDDFFRDLGLPTPSVNLGVGSGSHASQTAKVMLGFEEILVQRTPDVVV